MNNIDLKELRIKNKLTQQEMADLCNVSLRTIQNWESGDVEIPKNQEKMIAKAFNIVLPATLIKGHCNIGQGNCNNINSDATIHEIIQDLRKQLDIKDSQIEKLLKIIEIKENKNA